MDLVWFDVICDVDVDVDLSALTHNFCFFFSFSTYVPHRYYFNFSKSCTGFIPYAGRFSTVPVGI